MIQLEHVSRTYLKGKENEVTALNDVTLTIYPGEFVTVTGPSGSGKSTLLHMIEGTDCPDQGVCRLNGTDLSKAADGVRAKIRNREMGIILQDFGLFGDQTVLQNIYLPVLIARGNMKQAKKRAQELLEYLQIPELAKRKVSTLSGGQKQRTAIARGLMMDAPLLLADEPSGALDHTATEQLIRLLQRLNREGKTIVVVTHDPEMADSGSRKLYMEDGKLIEG